jgi:glycosyltransferase involved in cell wall biosynthesis
MKTDNLHFSIVATGWNCQQYTERCIMSVLNQTYKNFTLFVIDDASEDNTYREASRFVHDGVNIHRNEKNMGAAYSRYHTIQYIKTHMPDSVVLLLGLDDYLLPHSLERIKVEYDNEKLMTYGNWRGVNGYELPKGFLLYHDGAHRTRDYRSFKYRATAPNTFYAHLFKNFKEEDFMFEGEWIKATTESNLMLSLLEMCGKERIGVIEDIVYMYQNDRSDKAAFRFGRSYQDRIYNHVKRLPKRDLLP